MTRLVTDWQGKQTMTKDEALKMAIEQMNVYAHIHLCEHQCQDEELLDVIQACKEALEQQTMTYEQGFAHGYEAHRVEQENDKQESIVSLWDALTDEQPAQEPIHNCPNCNSLFTKEIYSTPAPSWQGLTDDEIGNAFHLSISKEKYETGLSVGLFARAIEAKLKEKNT